MTVFNGLLLLGALILVGGALYWMLIVTEGTFLGRRAVVWMYDITAHKYDAIKQYDDDAEQFFIIRPLLRNLGGERAPLVLDVAAGTGRLAWYALQEATFNGRVVSVEPSRRMLNQAAAKLAPYRHRASLTRATAVPLPFPDNAFHAVTCLEALEFLPSDQAALQEMARVLKPGGTLMVSRRRGVEGKLFLSKYRTVAEMEELLHAVGMIKISTQPWQIEYDLVLGRKPE